MNKTTAEEIVGAFERHVAGPLRDNLAKQDAYELAKRNPMIYTSGGATTVDEWVDRSRDTWARGKKKSLGSSLEASNPGAASIFS